MNQCPHADLWDLYRMLTQSHSDLGDRAAIEKVTPSNLEVVIQVIAGCQLHADAPGGCPAAARPRGRAPKRSSGWWTTQWLSTARKAQSPRGGFV
jgi:hypothetical protein